MSLIAALRSFFVFAFLSLSIPLGQAPTTLTLVLALTLGNGRGVFILILVGLGPISKLVYPMVTPTGITIIISHSTRRLVQSLTRLPPTPLAGLTLRVIATQPPKARIVTVGSTTAKRSFGSREAVLRWRRTGRGKPKLGTSCRSLELPACCP